MASKFLSYKSKVPVSSLCPIVVNVYVLIGFYKQIAYLYFLLSQFIYGVWNERLISLNFSYNWSASLGTWRQTGLLINEMQLRGQGQVFPIRSQAVIKEGEVRVMERETVGNCCGKRDLVGDSAQLKLQAPCRAQEHQACRRGA